MIASACRSASNRAMIWLLSMPGLSALSAPVFIGGSQSAGSFTFTTEADSPKTPPGFLPLPLAVTPRHRQFWATEAAWTQQDDKKSSYTAATSPPFDRARIPAQY